MLNLKSSIKASFVTISAFVMTLGLPLAALTSASADECTPPPPSSAGVAWPTGSDATTFTYQCQGQYAGKWTNAYYVYDPSTRSRSALYDRDYSYDCAAGKWTMTQWDFSPADQHFHQSRVAAADPGLPTNCPVPAPSPAAGASNTSSENQNSAASSAQATGAGTNNASNTTAGNTFNSTNSTTASVNNTITSVGTSGNALVLANTMAGSAASGDVTGIVNVVNKLQSASNSLGTDNNMIVFTANIDGDVNGDLMLDPNMLSQVQPASSSINDTDLSNKVTLNDSTDASINNDIDLSAVSGDTTVKANTSAGDATSGNAKAVANIINVINSAITSGKSFLGVINISGNLNGDILLPPDFIDQLLAANVPTVTISAPASTNQSTTDVSSTTDITNTNNQGITNNVHATADSGDATVALNTQAGNAISGNSSTNITAFNLTGSNVIGANDLLVFVNVLGKWVGLIVNAPAGSTAASLGGGITQNTTTAHSDTEVNNKVSQKINNNINASSRSGDATVSENTKAGNAKSGDAATAVNLMNVEDSSVSLTGWLGILFINVFGSWTGSFGVNTSAGDPVVTRAIAEAQKSGSSTPQVFRFVPNSSPQAGYNITPYSAAGGASSNNNGSAAPSSANSSAATALLANAHIKGTDKADAPQLQTQQSGFGLTSALIGGAVILFILGDAAYTRRHPERA